MRLKLKCTALKCTADLNKQHTASEFLVHYLEGVEITQYNSIDEMVPEEWNSKDGKGTEYHAQSIGEYVGKRLSLSHWPSGVGPILVCRKRIKPGIVTLTGVLSKNLGLATIENPTFDSKVSLNHFIEESLLSPAEIKKLRSWYPFTDN